MCLECDSAGGCETSCFTWQECCGGDCIIECDTDLCLECDGAGGCESSCDLGIVCCDGDCCDDPNKPNCHSGICVECEDEDDCGLCEVCNASNVCETITTCYHLESSDWVVGDCGCNLTTLNCEDNEIHYSLPTAVSGGPGKCKKRQDVYMPVGTEYSCEQGGATALGVVACAALEAVELAVCSIQCWAGLLNCLAVFYGMGDPAVCSDDYPNCIDCLEGLDIDCGCVLNECINGDPVGYDWMYADELYGGSCSDP